ncbi:MAG: YggS family pyridoxal phosphate-dependent enzyme [Proteobacteria bacterium]|nr:YggS family pyridoxal phosphate-dependent enzyme [Pseudomonadota bacterium]
MSVESKNLPASATQVAQRLENVRSRVQTALRDAGRSTDEILILAVSKRQPITAIEAAFLAGQTHYGENYVQEARAKIAALASLPIVWHFIGRLQANKSREVAERFQWVHTLDRMRIARRLNDQRPYGTPPLDVCIQVNQAGEPAKGGIDPEGVEDLARQIGQYPRLRLRGLTTIPPAATDPSGYFVELRRLRDRLQKTLGIPMDTLSMGMSADLESAVSAGSTIVRIGTAVFGPRPTGPRPAPEDTK